MNLIKYLNNIIFFNKNKFISVVEEDLLLYFIKENLVPLFKLFISKYFLIPKFSSSTLLCLIYFSK